MERQDIIHFLKPDKKRIALFIALIIVINIFPIFPCQADREIMIITSSSLFLPTTSFYNRSSLTLEFSYKIITNNYEWDDHYFYTNQPSIVGPLQYVEVDETISTNPIMFLLLYSLYLMLAYLASCWFAVSNLNLAESIYIRKKKNRENRVPESNFVLNCLDCGTAFPVMADWSGVCPKCKRGYMDKTCWTHKSGEKVGMAQMPSSSLNLQQNVFHWDKYQNNLDEFSDTIRKFKISYPKAILTLVTSFFILIVGIILVYCKVKYVEDTALLDYSGAGIVVFWLICAFSGFFIGKQIKKAWLAIPLVLVLIFITVYIGLKLGPIVLNASHSYGFLGMYIMQASSGALIIVAFAMVSLSRYYYS